MEKVKLVIEIEKDYYDTIKKYNGVAVPIGWNAIRDGKPYIEADTHDCISRKQVLDELMAHQYSQDFCKEHSIEYSINNSMVRIIVNGVQAVEPRIEYGVDGQPYKLFMSGGQVVPDMLQGWKYEEKKDV